MLMVAAFLRYGIITFTAPWVTAYYAFCTQPASLYKAMQLQSLYSILRAGRGVAAC